MAANLDVLRSAKDAAGRTLEVIELTQWPYFDLDGQTLMVSYANAYVANGGVVVPLANHPLDAEVLTFGGRSPNTRSLACPPNLGTVVVVRTASPSRFRRRMSALGDFEPSSPNYDRLSGPARAA